MTETPIENYLNVIGAPAVDPSLDTFAEQARARMMARKNALR